MIGIEHICICAKDTAALKDWYMDMFGWKVVYDNGKGTFFLKADDGGMIEFQKSDIEGAKDEMKTIGIRHIAISVDDFDGMVEKLKGAGVKVLIDAAVSAKGIGTMYFEDPDGNILHIIHRVTPL